MNNNLDFTVLMAVYGKDDPELFDKALASVISNTMLPKELLIVADGKLTTKLYSVIEKYESKINLKLLQLDKNVGLAGALNAGLEEISTKYTIRADADDINYVSRFKYLTEKLQEGFHLVGSSIREIDKAGNVIAIKECPEREDLIRKYAIHRNPFNHMSVGYQTDAVLKAGGYPHIPLKEDYALWASMLARGNRVFNIKQVLVDATTGDNMFKRRGGLKYAISEMELQRHLLRCGIKNYIQAFFDGLARATVFLVPNVARKMIYLSLLRKR